MFKKILIIFLLGVGCTLLSVPKAKAAGEFSTSYNVTYDVDDTGSTAVTERVSLKNLTDSYYASSFSLLIGATKISDVSAEDSGGSLQVTSSQQGTKTKIDVVFGSQVAGKDKVYNWTLHFRSMDFAQAQGKVWQVSVPRITSESDVGQYSLTLSVPVSFGDPTSILPSPQSESESGGKINLFFNKDQLTEAGILANFGNNQLFSFNMIYHLSNPSVLPAVARLPLPADTDYQQIELDNISPKPDNVIIDPDGNYIGLFNLSRRSNLEVHVSGLAKLNINSLSKTHSLSQSIQQTLTSQQKYWEKDNPLITEKLNEIFKDGVPKTNSEKARLINNFVVDSLKYDNSRLNQNNFTRLGGLTALNNPDSALCSEFTDLFITLARAAGVPSRELDGYAYTANTDLRPLSFGSTILHSWPEYFDPDRGWVMIDPTWQNTTGGVNYFSKFDLNHLVLATRGYSSIEPTTADTVLVSFSDAEFKPAPNLTFNIDSPPAIFAGFPSSFKVMVENSGSSALLPSTLNLHADRVSVAGESSVSTPILPPFGHFNYAFALHTPGLLDNFDDNLSLQIAGQTVNQKVEVRPIYQFKFFPAIVFGTLGLMVFIYSSVLGLHIYHKRK